MRLSKRYGFYPTPEDASSRLLERTNFVVDIGAPALRVLEPSAGTGNLARLCVHHDDPTTEAARRWGRHHWSTVDCVEIQPTLAAELTDERIYNRVFCQDFLHLDPKTTGLYDRIVMNPPFDRERDIDHVMHALKFLKPDGQLVAIMSAGTEFRETKKSIAFRALMEKMKASWRDLPAGSFSEVGTNVNTLTLSVYKDSRAQSRYR